MQAASREVAVILRAFLHRSIASSGTRFEVREFTRVTSVKLTSFAFIEGLQDRTRVRSFEIIYFELLDPEILGAASSILRLFQISTPRTDQPTVARASST